MNVRNAPSNSVVTRMLQKNGYTSSDVVRLLDTSLNTFNRKLRMHGFFNVREIIFISGLCQVKPEVLFYILMKEQRNVGKIQHNREKLNYYIDNVVKEEGERLIKWFEK